MAAISIKAVEAMYPGYEGDPTLPPKLAAIWIEMLQAHCEALSSRTETNNGPADEKAWCRWFANRVKLAHPTEFSGYGIQRIAADIHDGINH